MKFKGLLLFAEVRVKLGKDIPTELDFIYLGTLLVETKHSLLFIQYSVLYLMI